MHFEINKYCTLICEINYKNLDLDDNINSYNESGNSKFR